MSNNNNISELKIQIASDLHLEFYPSPRLQNLVKKN